MKSESTCLGCDLANYRLNTYVVYEDEYVSCILDYQPFNPGHILILPKKHYKEIYELDENTHNSVRESSILLSKAINKVYNPDGITICQNGGIFSELNHYHIHIVPRYEGQDFYRFYIESEELEYIEASVFEEVKLKLQEAISLITSNS